MNLRFIFAFFLPIKILCVFIVQTLESQIQKASEITYYHISLHKNLNYLS